MKNIVIICILVLSIILLIIRAFFPIPIDKSIEIINGINLYMQNNKIKKLKDISIRK